MLKVSIFVNSNTTHVVFKDGRLSTYKKAKLWSIPIVSILWIEACRCQVRLCNTNNYQISNKAWYDSREAKSKVSKTFKKVLNILKQTFYRYHQNDVSMRTILVVESCWPLKHSTLRFLSLPKVKKHRTI